MFTFAAAATFAREMACESGRDVYVSPDVGAGWKFRHQDGSIPRLALEAILERDAEIVEEELSGLPLDPTCYPAHWPDRHQQNSSGDRCWSERFN